MGYVPEWARGSQAKTSTKVEHGIKKMELFHNASKPGSNANQTPFTRHYADGSEGGVKEPSFAERIGTKIDSLFRGDSNEVNVRGEKVGKYEGDDPIVKMRMGMTDYQGNDLRIPKASMRTSTMDEMSDRENGPGVDAPAASTPAPAAPKPEAAKPSNFNAAFAEARKSGAKQFEFKGKKYTTELASGSGNKYSKTYDDLVSTKDKEIEGYTKTSENMNLDADTRADMKRRAAEATRDRDTYRRASDYFKKKKQ